MVKGFISFRGGKIPFVIENYRMELFTDDSLLDNFCKEYNFKENYILHGQCFDTGIGGRKATFWVENSMGSTCYLRCYIVNMFGKDKDYDAIGLQSPSLDEVFRYEYEYIDMVRSGINLALEPKIVYTISFDMNSQNYELEFRIGHNNRLGLLEDLDRRGELILPLHTNEIQECYDIAKVLHRLAMFMTSHAEVPFKRITLYVHVHTGRQILLTQRFDPIKVCFCHIKTPPYARLLRESNRLNFLFYKKQSLCQPQLFVC